MIRPQKHIHVTVARHAFAANIRVLREILAPSRLCVVMKSNACGPGLEPLLPAAVEAGADCLGICTNEEEIGNPFAAAEPLPDSGVAVAEGLSCISRSTRESGGPACSSMTANPCGGSAPWMVYGSTVS